MEQQRIIFTHPKVFVSDVDHVKGLRYLTRDRHGPAQWVVKFSHVRRGMHCYTNGGAKVQVTGHRSGHRLRVTGHRLQVTNIKI